MKEWHNVCAIEELESTGCVIARLGGREIGVLRRPDGGLTAVRNRCPHHGAPLCLGTVYERLVGEPGRYATSGRPVLRCPWHGWEFELDTGRCADEPSLRAAVYAVQVVDGRVLVEA
jgi:3-phenylpropionate/trans-cinnamate dioxygenase ferredoxin subunit